MPKHKKSSKKDKQKRLTENTVVVGLIIALINLITALVNLLAKLLQ